MVAPVRVSASASSATGDAEVDDARAVGGEQHVGRLEVAVDDARGVDGLQRLGQAAPSARTAGGAAGRARRRPRRGRRRARRGGQPGRRALGVGVDDGAVKAPLTRRAAVTSRANRAPELGVPGQFAADDLDGDRCGRRASAPRKTWPMPPAPESGHDAVAADAAEGRRCARTSSSVPLSARQCSWFAPWSVVAPEPPRRRGRTDRVLAAGADDSVPRRRGLDSMPSSTVTRHTRAVAPRPGRRRCCRSGAAGTRAPPARTGPASIRPSSGPPAHAPPGGIEGEELPAEIGGVHRVRRYQGTGGGGPADVERPARLTGAGVDRVERLALKVGEAEQPFAAAAAARRGATRTPAGRPAGRGVECDELRRGVDVDGSAGDGWGRTSPARRHGPTRSTVYTAWRSPPAQTTAARDDRAATASPTVSLRTATGRGVDGVQDAVWAARDEGRPATAGPVTMRRAGTKYRPPGFPLRASTPNKVRPFASGARPLPPGAPPGWRGGTRRRVPLHGPCRSASAAAWGWDAAGDALGRRGPVPSSALPIARTSATTPRRRARPRPRPRPTARKRRVRHRDRFEDRGRCGRGPPRPPRRCASRRSPAASRRRAGRCPPARAGRGAAAVRRGPGGGRGPAPGRPRRRPAAPGRRRRRAGALVDGAVDQHVGRPLPVRPGAGRGEHQDRAEREHVGGGPRRHSAGLLRGHEAGRPDGGARAGHDGGVRGVGDAEVDDAGPVGGQDHVGRLEVAVHDPGAVDRHQRLGEARAQGQHGGGRRQRHGLVQRDARQVRGGQPRQGGVGVGVDDRGGETRR